MSARFALSSWSDAGARTLPRGPESKHSNAECWMLSEKLPGVCHYLFQRLSRLFRTYRILLILWVEVAWTVKSEPISWTTEYIFHAMKLSNLTGCVNAVNEHVTKSPDSGTWLSRCVDWYVGLGLRFNTSPSLSKSPNSGTWLSRQPNIGPEFLSFIHFYPNRSGDECFGHQKVLK